MMSGLLDSAIVIDVLRSYLPAVNWLSTQTDLGISQIVVLEVLEGADNKVEQQGALRQLRRFTQIEVTSDDIAWAITRLEIYHLSHNVGAMDCLIAAPADRLQVPLYTRNLKHFAPLLSDLARQPY